MSLLSLVLSKLPNLLFCCLRNYQPVVAPAGSDIFKFLNRSGFSSEFFDSDFDLSLDDNLAPSGMGSIPREINRSDFLTIIKNYQNASKYYF